MSMSIGVQRLRVRMGEATREGDDFASFSARLREERIVTADGLERLRNAVEHWAELVDPPEQVRRAKDWLASPEGSDALTIIWQHSTTPESVQAEQARVPEPEPIRDRLTLELMGWADRLLPGSVKLLADRWRDALGHLSPGELAAAVAERFAEPLPDQGERSPRGVGRSYLDPEAKAPKAHPVKQALQRAARSGVIPESSVGLLFNQWAADLATFDEVAAARVVRGRLAEWDNRRYVSPGYKPAMPIDAGRVHRLLTSHFGVEAGSVERAEELAFRHRDLARWGDEAEAVRVLSERLHVGESDGRRQATRLADGSISYGLAAGAKVTGSAFAPTRQVDPAGAVKL